MDAKALLPEDDLDAVVVRFAGDSGDGIQLLGSQFTTATAIGGSGIATFPDFPAEIRAPAGTTFGVSAYQVKFGARTIFTSGDEPDVLVALNPAALKTNLPLLREGGLVILDKDTFIDRNLKKAELDSNPLEDGTLDDYKVMAVDITKLTLEAVKDLGLGNKEAHRCKNMWALGLTVWTFGQDRAPIITWLEQKFASNEIVCKANIAALNAGHVYGEAAEESGDAKQYHVGTMAAEPGTYRTVNGAQALAWGLVAGSQLSDLQMIFSSYPITPASPLLHQLSQMKEFGVLTFQAEDEIAAACAALGTSFAGSLGVTSSSGPGIALKGETIGLAISAELPMVIVNAQRGGPSTGLPTKTEQSDLYQAIYGRNGDAPIPVVATRSPGDCFDAAIEAVRLALKYMTPVMLLTDGYIMNASEPWKLPDVTSYDPIPHRLLDKPRDEEEPFNPFERDPKTLARQWAKLGTKGLEHRIGGIEKSYDTGHISYDPENHQKMTEVRRAKVDGIAQDIPQQIVDIGPNKGRLAVVGWGSTYGPIARAVRIANAEGHNVSHIHLRHINPLPENLGDLLAGFDRVLVPEMNMGQLITVLRDHYLLRATPFHKVSGQPFKISEILGAIHDQLGINAEEYKGH